MSISVKSFDELPVSHERYRIDISKKNSLATISLEETHNNNAILMVGDSIIHTEVDSRGRIQLRSKHTIKRIAHQ
jgi:hypothetical protein